MRRRLSVLVHASLTILTLLAVFPAAVPAQQAAPQAGISGHFTDTLDVQAVHVDVVVTDERRNRIQGASRNRFLLRGVKVPRYRNGGRAMKAAGNQNQQEESKNLDGGETFAGRL